MEECKNAFQIPTDKPTAKSPMGRPKHYIILDLINLDINTENCIDSGQDKDYWKFLETPGFLIHLVIITTLSIILLISGNIWTDLSVTSKSLKLVNFIR